ncbi:hypothetical protein AURDEDRAFT_116494 [Auricularia subglabra TFB-10046 SS5]|nr:hypothetical protein AURDEDRAFT_116494 [Auricularia subglabra TFB-10046 SS5]
MDARRLEDALRCTAPILETVRITDGTYCYSRGGADLPILWNRTLQNIDIHGFTPSYLAGCIGSPTLRTLRVCTPPTGTSLTALDWSILCSFPALEVLAVRDRNPGFVDSLSHQCPFPATLRSLHLDMDCDTIHGTLRSNNLALLSSLHISLWDDDSSVSLADFRPFLAEDFASASMSFEDIFAHLMATSPTGQQMVVRGAQYNEDCWAMISHVRTLCLAGFGVQGGYAPLLATFPVLQDLTLDVTPQQNITPEPSMWLYGIPNSPKLPQQLRLVCPELRSLRIASATDAGPLRLDDVVSFLRKALGTGSKKLSVLRFHRIPVRAAGDVDVVAVLHEFAETISNTTGDELWPGCDQLWNKDWESSSF